MEEVQQEAIKVRKNMARLRELKADAVLQQIAAGAAPKAMPKKRP
jgi:hypothetical protein